MTQDQPNYTLKAAAKRVERSVSTLERWIADGLAHRLVAGVTVIDHDDLMAFYRAKLLANPSRKKNSRKEKLHGDG